MMKIVSVELDERVVVTRRGLPLRALGPAPCFPPTGSARSRSACTSAACSGATAAPSSVPRVQVFSVLEAMPELSKELANVIPKDH